MANTQTHSHMYTQIAFNYTLILGVNNSQSCLYAYKVGEKVGLQLRVCETQFILVLLFINYCIIFV